MEDNLNVAVGAKAMAARLKIGPDGLMVVDFPVADEMNIALFIGDRLMAAGDVDDAEPTHCQPGIAPGLDALVIGAAMRHRGAHCAKPVR